MREYDQKRRKERIAIIATKIILGMIKEGEIPDTDEAVRAATPEAVKIAAAAHDATEEFLS